MASRWLFALFLGLSPIASHAAELTMLGDFAAWHAYSYDDDGGKVCFMSSSPVKSDISNASATRDEPELFITHWTADNAANVISVNLGYVPEGKVTIQIDGKSYDMIPNGETAWMESSEKDSALTLALQKGSSAVVQAASARGTRTSDTYSLKSSATAYKAISQSCGV